MAQLHRQAGCSCPRRSEISSSGPTSSCKPTIAVPLTASPDTGEPSSSPPNESSAPGADACPGRRRLQRTAALPSSQCPQRRTGTAASMTTTNDRLERIERSTWHDARPSRFGPASNQAMVAQATDTSQCILHRPDQQVDAVRSGCDHGLARDSVAAFCASDRCASAQGQRSVRLPLRNRRRLDERRGSPSRGAPRGLRLQADRRSGRHPLARGEDAAARLTRTRLFPLRRTLVCGRCSCRAPSEARTLLEPSPAASETSARAGDLLHRRRHRVPPGDLRMGSQASAAASMSAT